MFEVLDDPSPPEFGERDRRMVHERAQRRSRVRQLGLVMAVVLPLALLIGGLALITSSRGTETTPVAGTVTSPVAPTAPPDSSDTNDPVATTAVPVAAATRPLAIGGSVVLGAGFALTEAGFAVDGARSSFSDGAEALEEMAARGDVPDTVMVSLADDSPILEDDLMRLLQGALRTSNRVVFVTSTADRDYAAANNDLIRALPSQYANVTVLDWASDVADCPGDCLYSDGMHLRPDGQAWFTQLAVNAIKIPTPFEATGLRTGDAINSNGTIPGMDTNGQVGLELVPEWTPVSADGATILGFVRKPEQHRIPPPPGSGPADLPLTIYDDDSQPIGEFAIDGLPHLYGDSIEDATRPVVAPEASSTFDEFVASLLQSTDQADLSTPPVQDRAFDATRLMSEAPDVMRFTAVPVPGMVAYWKDSANGPVVLTTNRTGATVPKTFEENQRDAQTILDNSKTATITNLIDVHAVRLGSNAGTVTTTTTTRGVEFMLGDNGITITTPITTPETKLVAMATRFAAID
jgi:hypothetical protein